MKVTLKNKRMKFVKLEQNTPEWDEWRQKGIGASVGYAAMNMSKALFDQFLNAKVPASIDHMPAIQRGNELEKEARDLIEMEIMAAVIPACAERGFMHASADGIEFESGKVISGHEIKSPDVKTHEKHLRGELGHQKFHQLQQSMYVFGLKSWNFWSYCPEHGTPLHRIEVPRDNEYIARMIEKSEEFWNRVLNRSWPDAEAAGVELAAQVASGVEAPAIVSNVDIPAELAKRSSNIVTAICSIESVSDDSDASKMTDLLSASKMLLKSLEDARKDIVQPHWDFKKKVDGLFKRVTDEIKTVDGKGRRLLLDYKNEQERIQREKEAAERARIEAAMRKQREEQERIEAERRAAAEAAMREAKSKAEAEAAEKAMREAEAEAERQRIEAEKAAELAAVAQKPVTQTRGTFGSAGTRKRWAFKVKCISDLGEDFLLVNEKAINAEIKAQVAKGKAPEIYGVEIYQENILSVR